MTLWGVSSTTVGRLRAYGAPFELLLLVAHVTAVHSSIARELDIVELFAGAGELSDQCKAAGLRATAYDICHNAITNDFTSDIGFLHAVFLAPLL